MPAQYSLIRNDSEEMPLRRFLHVIEAASQLIYTRHIAVFDNTLDEKQLLANGIKLYKEPQQ